MSKDLKHSALGSASTKELLAGWVPASWSDSEAQSWRNLCSRYRMNDRSPTQPKARQNILSANSKIHDKAESHLPSRLTPESDLSPWCTQPDMSGDALPTELPTLQIQKNAQRRCEQETRFCKVYRKEVQLAGRMWKDLFNAAMAAGASEPLQQ